MEKSSWKQFVPALIVWAGAVAIGMAILWNYASTPGTPATPTEQWPTDTQIQRVSGKATLIMLAHPQCPCTRASIRELALIMTRCQGLLTAHVLFFKPKNFARDWEKTDLWQQASIIPGVEVGCDIDGIEARRFHSGTSGQTLLYDSQGRLLFSGGITIARGHSGDNAGRSTIVSLLTNDMKERTGTAVFGCSLFAPASN